MGSVTAAVLQFPLPASALAAIPKPSDVGPEYWKSFERARNAYQGIWRVKLVRKILADINGVVLQTLRQAPSVGGAMAFIEQRLHHETAASWARTLDELYAHVGGGFAGRTIESLTTEAKDGPFVLGAVEDVWLQVVGDWLRMHGGSRIRKITDGLLADVRRELEESVRKGEGVEQAARRLARLSPELAGTRAVLVAQTEIIAASNLGARAGAIQTGLDLDHEWIATPGSRTRAAHAAASGQIQPMAQPFIVWGEELMFPGDGSRGATVKNLARCRCTVGFRPAGKRVSIDAEASGPSWRPTMTEAEAREWLEGSVYREFTNHRTSQPEEAFSAGVRVDAGHRGNYGQGFYTSAIEDEKFGIRNERVAIRMQNPLVGTRAEVDRVLQKLNPEENPMPGHTWEASARKRLLEAGYDGVILQPAKWEPVSKHWVIAIKEGTAVLVR